MSRRRRLPLVLATIVAATTSIVLAGPAANANPDISVAVFGDNQVDDYLTSETFTVDLVTMAELESPGFLDGFDVFFYTRDGFGGGQTLSPGAAANVQSFVGGSGRGVLLNGDFADALPNAEVSDPQIAQLISNSVSWAAGGSGGGFVGEYTGAAAGLTSNANGLAPLGFIQGSAGPLDFGPAVGSIEATSIGQGSPILSGITLPTDPVAVEFGSIFSGVASSHVLAVYNNPGGGNDGNPAILSFTTADEVVVCETGGECEIEGSGDGGSTETTITAEGDGVLKASFESDGIDCTYPAGRPFRGRDYEEISGFTSEFFFEGNGDIVVVGQVSRERMREIGIRSLLLQSCFGGPRPFLQLDRTPAELVGDEYVGLLPNCRRVDDGLPCVSQRRPFQGLITTVIPFAYHLGEDPKKRF